MKSVILLLLSLSSVSFAEVVKPQYMMSNTSTTVEVDGFKYNYSVADRGWHSLLQFADKKAEVKAQKAFILVYTPLEEATSLSAVQADAQFKCESLAHAELQEQTSMLDNSYASTLSASITRSVRNTDGSLRAVCVVDLLVQRP